MDKASCWKLNRRMSRFFFFSFLFSLWWPTPGITGAKFFTFSLPAAKIHSWKPRKQKIMRFSNSKLIDFLLLLLALFLFFPSCAPHLILIVADLGLHSFFTQLMCHVLIKFRVSQITIYSPLILQITSLCAKGTTQGEGEERVRDVLSGWGGWGSTLGPPVVMEERPRCLVVLHYASWPDLSGVNMR